MKGPRAPQQAKAWRRWSGGGRACALLIGMGGALSGAALGNALAACNPAGSGPSEGTRQNPSTTCTKAGANCEYAPGKIGLCIEKEEGCDAGGCLACVSLH
jgi:hypothetical protein